LGEATSDNIDFLSDSFGQNCAQNHSELHIMHGGEFMHFVIVFIPVTVECKSFLLKIYLF